ncbi:MAG: serine--tRNA ligase [Anaerolineaceae bacterium]|nr:serine--tRNA ligase [Anaerolineaceae bacterium]
MIDLNLIRSNPDFVREALRRRAMNSSVVDDVLTLDVKRRTIVTEVEGLKAERNRVSKEIGKQKDQEARQLKITAMREARNKISHLDEELRIVDQQLNSTLAGIPNIPDQDVPIGKDDSENIVLRVVGEKPQYNFEPKPHWELGTELGIIDFERGVKITGSRFYILSGAGALLQRALISYMLDLHIRQGYTEKYPPFMVREATLYASGQLPKFVDNLYHDVEDDLWMLPTSEVALTGMHMNEVLDEVDLPLRYTAYTPCFRREKMSAGRDVRGIKRGHQFDKVEMYSYTHPENSEAELEKMVADAAETCEKLGLIYRVVQLCTGDLSFGARKAFDLEVWAPGCGEWLEVSSVSNVGDFQARRANIKFKPTEKGKKQYPHTLNGSGLGMPRVLIAVMETYQQEDGSIRIPDVLKPWMSNVGVITSGKA